MSGSSLMRSSTAITERAREKFAADQVELIKHTIMPPNSNDGELAMFLEVSARYELDPFTGQIWAVRFQGKVRNVVGKDGWLALANREPDFRGCQSFEIRQFDYFVPDVDEHGHVRVDHRWLDEKGEPTHGGADGSLRGPIIGAFAYVRREGHVDTQFLAYQAQYDKRQNAWTTHPSAMMVKVAEAMALRKAYPLSGLYSEFEVPADREATNLSSPAAPIQIDFGPDEELAHDLEDAFHHLGYTRAKVRTIMRACSTREDREKVLAGLKAEADGVVDAVVVEPDTPTAA